MLTTYAGQKGLSVQKARACLADKSLQQAVNQTQRFYMSTYQVNATPTTVIESKKGRQQKVVGADMDEIEKAIDSLL